MTHVQPLALSIQLNLATFFIFFVLFRLTGIPAGVAGLYWHKTTVGVGSSGAIPGLYSVFLAFVYWDTK